MGKQVTSKKSTGKSKQASAGKSSKSASPVKSKKSSTSKGQSTVKPKAQSKSTSNPPTKKTSKTTTQSAANSKKPSSSNKSSVSKSKGKQTKSNSAKDPKASSSKSKEDSSPSYNIPPYRKLKQNLYRLPLQRPAFDKDDDNILECDCSIAKGGCNEHCQNRLLYTECVPELCHCTQIDPNTKSMIYCQNTVLQQQSFPQCEVFPTSECGFGLRVLEDVPSNTILTEYMGEVITKDEYYDRLQSYRADDNLYFASLGQQLMLDANHMGSIARFANHSCEPNSMMQKWNVKNEPRIVLTSLRPLRAGEEITYNYNFFSTDELEADENRRRKKIQKQVCHCGSAYCTGIVGGENSQTNYLVGEKIPKLIQRGQEIIAILTDDSKQGSSEAVCTKDSVQQVLQQAKEIISTITFGGVQVEQLQQIVNTINPHFQQLISLEKEVEDSIVSFLGSKFQVLKPQAQNTIEGDNVDKMETNQKKAARLITIDEVIQYMNKLEVMSIKSRYYHVLKQLIQQYISICKAVRSFFTEYQLDTTSCDDLLLRLKPFHKHSKYTATTAEIVNTVQSHPHTENVSLQDIEGKDTVGKVATLPTHSSTTSLTTTATTITTTKSTSKSTNKPYKWRDLLALLKQVVEVFPVEIPSMDIIVKHYIQVCTWSNRNLTKYIPLDFQDMKHRDLFVIEKLYKVLIASYLQSNPKLQDAMSSEDIGKISSLPTDIMKAMSYLNTFLNIAVEREDVLKQRHIPIPKRKIKSSQEQPEEEEEEEQVYFCLCQLPEDSNFCHGFTQCNQCDAWYHLPCLNYPQFMIKRVNQQDQFFCHLCQWSQGDLSGFTLLPNSEWKYFDVQEQAVYEEAMKKRGLLSKSQSANKQTASKLEKEGNTIKSEPAIHSSAGRDEAPVNIEQGIVAVVKLESKKAVTPFTQLKLNTLLTTTNNNSLGILQSLQDYWKSCQTKKRLQTYFTLDDLLRYTQEAKSLPIDETPAVDILDYMEVKVNRWQVRVTNFLNTNRPTLLQEIENSIQSTEDYRVSEVLTTLYQEMLHLYFEMYVFRLKPTALLGTLRVWIWTIAAIPLFRVIHNSSNDQAEAEQSRPQEAQFSYEEVEEVMKAADWMKTQCNSVDSHLLSYVEMLQTFWSELQSCLQRVKKCKGSVEATSLFETLYRYDKYVSVKHMYAYAKAACFLRPIQIRRQIEELMRPSTNQEEKPTESSETHSSDPLVECEGNHILPMDIVAELTLDDHPHREIDVLNNAAKDESQVEPATAPNAPLKKEDSAEEKEAQCSILQNCLSKVAEVDNNELYCWCRQKDDQDVMVCCDRCEDWFHSRCIGIALKRRGGRQNKNTDNTQGLTNKKKRKLHQLEASELQNESAEFICISCSAIIDKDYPYVW